MCGYLERLSAVSGGSASFLVTLVVFNCILTTQVNGEGLPIQNMLVSKRVAGASAADMGDGLNEDAISEYQSGSTRYDEYPVVVPKRAALILDRLLKHLESNIDKPFASNDWDSPMMRRGNQYNKEKIYFRCYFNAVSCYRKK